MGHGNSDVRKHALSFLPIHRLCALVIFLPPHAWTGGSIQEILFSFYLAPATPAPAVGPLLLLLPPQGFL